METGRLKINYTLVLFFLISLVLSFQSLMAQVVPADNMKWDPGHFILNESSNLDTIITDFKNIPAVKGVVRTYNWSQLESSKGSYNFSAIDADLKLLSSNGKKLGLMIGYKYKDGLNAPSNLPNYVLNLPKQLVGGITVSPYYKLDPNKNIYNIGDHANFGHPGTLESFSNLLKELAKHYDSNPNFALIQFIESSSGVAVDPAHEDNFLQGGMLMEKNARQAFVKTPLFKNINFPRNMLQEFIANLTVNKMGFGGPDIFTGAFDDSTDGLTRVDVKDVGVYNYYKYNHNSLTGTNSLPISMMAHTANFIYDTFADRNNGIKNGLTGADSVDAILKFAVERLHPNYLIWQLYPGEKIYYPAFKNLMASEAAKNPASLLGLITSCPTNYTSCAGLPPPNSDTTPPIVAITSPTAGVNIVDSTNVNVMASDSSGVSHVELYANGTLVDTDNYAPYSITYTVPTGTNADVTLKARAYDIHGNFSDSSDVVVHASRSSGTGDTTGPNITIQNPSNGEIIYARQYSLLISATAADPSGVSQMSIFINNNWKKTVYSNQISFTWAVRYAKAGYYDIRIRARDKKGNIHNKTIRIKVNQ